MSRRITILLGLMVLASLFVTLGALGWRWREAGDFAAMFAGPKPVRPIMLSAVPFLLAGLMVFTTRADESRKPSRYEKGFVGLTIATHFGVILAMQGWMAMVYLGGALPDREFVTRLLAAFLGFGMAVRGNFFAKLPAPAGDSLGVWMRTSRHTALMLVLTGLGLAGCAVSLPIPGVLAALGGAFLLILMLAHAQKRATATLETAAPPR